MTSMQVTRLRRTQPTIIRDIIEQRIAAASAPKVAMLCVCVAI
jgi:hypothetical protein